jgi:hypothetical protein
MQYNNFIEKARSWIGTPFHPKAKIKKVGCDCVGFILGVLEELFFEKKLIVPDYFNPFKESVKLLSFMEKNFEKRPIALGSILLIKLSETQYHIALITALNPLQIIHSSSSLGVIEEVLPLLWKEKILGSFSLGGLDPPSS